MRALEFIVLPYALSGFGVGFVVGLTGVGGGSLMTPLLVLLFGIHPATAIGTDLRYASVTKSVGTAVHGVSRNVEWRMVGFLAMGSAPATALTILALYVAGQKGQPTPHFLSTVLGIAVMLTAGLILMRRKVVAWLGPRIGPDGPRNPALWTVLTGATLGALVTLSSVGAGALGVTALVLLYPHMPISRIVGSDIAHAVPLTLLAGMGHWWLGTVDLHLLGSLLTGSVPGIIIGSLIAVRVPESVTRPALATVLIVVGGKLVF